MDVVNSPSLERFKRHAQGHVLVGLGRVILVFSNLNDSVLL